MFEQARIKLTLYYLAIAMGIMLCVSFLTYRGFVFEFQRGLRQRVYRIPPNAQNLPAPLGMFLIPDEPDETEVQIFREARQRMLLNLFAINMGVLVITGAGGYFLAGRTLKPIEKMVDEQICGVK